MPRGEIYQRHFHAPRRERLFLSSVAFFLTFGIVRLVTHAIRASIGPFHDVTFGQTHFHHLVFGIFLLLAVGYLWLVQVDIGRGPAPKELSRLMAILYGIGAALTLDEFALWLNLEDVYWAREGRLSVDAVILFGTLLSIGVWGGRFLHEATRELLRVLRR